MMKDKSLPTIDALAGVLLAAALSLAIAAPLHAENEVASQTISMNAGQTQIIDHLRKDSKPVIRVIENPHALVIHDETPGQLVLLGAERGRWDVTVTRDDGAQVAYHVSVAAIADEARPLDGPAAPVALSDDDSWDEDSTDDESSVAKSLGEKSSAEKSYRPTVVVAESKSASRALGATHVVDAGAAVPASFAVDALPETSVPSGDDAKPPAALPGSNQAAFAQAQVPSLRYRSDPPAADGGPIAPGSRNYMPADVISLMNGASEIYDFSNRLKRVSIADSTVADVQVTSPYQLNLIGHKPGFTTLTVWDNTGHYEQRQIRIDAGGKQQVMLNAIVAELDRSKLENQGIDLSIALTKSGLSLSSLPGGVATPYGPTSQLTAGTGAVPGVSPPGGQLLPLLLSSTMTYGLSYTSASYSGQSLLEYLESNNLGRILAQPHLLANSGQSASFLSGGEIPIVLAQALNTSIVFKEFGTKVDCRPTVIGRSDIELLVKTEVSEPDFAHGVQLFGFQVPAFVTRKADTLVRLRDGQTLIIAGLILRNRNAVVNKVPYLGDIPYAGDLFRNTQWQDSTTDLVMSVKPEIVAPLPANGQVFEPSERGPMTESEIRTQRLQTPDAARPRF